MDTSTPELGVTKAVEEELSPVARIRLELAAVDEAMESDEPKSGWQYSNALFQLNLGLSSKLHMLIDRIDQQAQELDALRAQVAALEADKKKLHYSAEMAHHFVSKTQRVIVNDPTLYNREIAAYNESALTELATVLNEMDHS